MRSYWRDGKDGKTVVQVKYWQLAGAAPPTTIRIATFTDTIRQGVHADDEIQMLDREIRAAEFTKLTSEEVQSLVRGQNQAR